MTRNGGKVSYWSGTKYTVLAVRILTHRTSCPVQQCKIEYDTDTDCVFILKNSKNILMMQHLGDATAMTYRVANVNFISVCCHYFIFCLVYGSSSQLHSGEVLYLCLGTSLWRTQYDLACEIKLVFQSDVLISIIQLL